MEQVDLSLCWVYMSGGTFSHFVAHIIIIIEDLVSEVLQSICCLSENLSPQNQDFSNF